MKYMSYFHKLNNNDLILVKEDKTYFVYHYHNQELKREVPFGSYISALNFINKFKGA